MPSRPKKTTGRTPSARPAFDWRTVEALGLAHFTNKGWRVLISPHHNSCYDFAAEKDGVFIRVNVKSATPSNRGYLISRSGRVNHKTDPDLYLAWLPDQHRFVEVPASVLKKKVARLTNALLRARNDKDIFT